MKTAWMFQMEMQFTDKLIQLNLLKLISQQEDK